MFNKWLVFIIVLYGLCLHGADGPRFDVVSIRLHAQDDSQFGVKMPANGRFSSTGTVAKLVMMVAFDVQEAQIVGAPDWFDRDKWDIEARSGDEVTHSPEETRQMLQIMLSERFALSVHKETQQRPAYVLTIAKGGPKFRPQAQEGPTNIRTSRNSIALEKGELDRMTQLLSAVLGRPVVDRTGLSGLFDLSLRWDDAPVPNGPLGLDERATTRSESGSIFTAIQEQLGLRLEPQRVPVEVIVIDHIEKPSPN